MALGNTKISNLEYYVTNVNGTIDVLKDCLNTFNYVVNGLSEWADETTVGSKTIDEAKVLNQKISETIENTEELSRVIQNLIERQKELDSM